MTVFLDTRGRSSLAIGICGRCSRKFPIGDLQPDPNYPGLLVCRADRDEFDPYRLPARQTENIALRYARPDTPLDGSSPESPPPPPEPVEGIVFDFVNGEYSINGVSVPVEEAIVAWVSPVPSTFTYADIIPGVGWVPSDYSVGQLTPAALSAIGSGPYQGKITLLTDVSVGAEVYAGASMYLIAPTEEQIGVQFSRNFGSFEDYLSVIADGGSADAVVPTGLPFNEPFDINFSYEVTNISVDANGGPTISALVVSGPQTTVTFTPYIGSPDRLMAIRRIEISPGVALIGVE